MDKSISSNKFYSTFTPFINEKSKTADKTIGAAKFEHPLRKTVEYKKENLIKTATAGGALAVGLAGVCMKRSSLIGTKRFLDSSIAKLNLGSNDIFTRAIKTVLGATRFTTNKLLCFTDKLNRKREMFFRKLNMPDNQTFLGNITKRISGFFKTNAAKSTAKKYDKLIKELDDVEKALNSRIEVIEASAQGKVKLVLPKEVLKQPSENPIAVNLSLLPDGSSRAAKLRETMAEAKQLLHDLRAGFDSGPDSRVNKIGDRGFTIDKALNTKVKLITKNIEYNFAEAKKALEKLTHIAGKTSPNNENMLNCIREVNETLCKYRFNTIVENAPKIINNGNRHLLDVLRGISKLEEIAESCPDKKAIQIHINNFKRVFLEELCDRDTAGLMGKIRSLLKCNDVPCDFIKPELKPSLLKHYQTNEYLDLKAQINSFIHKLHKTVDYEQNILPRKLAGIASGDQIVDSAILLAPGAYVTGKAILGSKKENTKEQPRVLPYWAGAGMFVLTNAVKMFSLPFSITASLLTTLFTTKIQNHFTKE